MFEPKRSYELCTRCIGPVKRPSATAQATTNRCADQFSKLLHVAVDKIAVF